MKKITLQRLIKCGGPNTTVTFLIAYASHKLGYNCTVAGIKVYRWWSLHFLYFLLILTIFPNCPLSLTPQGVAFPAHCVPFCGHFCSL